LIYTCPIIELVDHPQASTSTGNRRQQYSLAELPFVCEFCPARYKTKPGLHYHLAKHKESNGEHRSSSAIVDHNQSSLSPTSSNGSSSMNKHKHPHSSMDPQQYAMYGHPHGSGPPTFPHYNNGPPGMMPTTGTPPYPMPPQQALPYGMAAHPHSMLPSSAMPLTAAALSGSSPANGNSYYPSSSKQSVPSGMINIGSQCDFCGGNEQENKATKLPEQMITCKVMCI
jgi:hypothetical protein